jgi:hypothetical protein
MRFLLFGMIGAFLLAAVTWTLYPGTGAGIILGIAIALAWATIRRMPAAQRGDLFRDFRVELVLVTAACVGLLFMAAVGPAMSQQFRERFGLLWLIVVAGYLASLLVKTMRKVMTGMSDRN